MADALMLLVSTIMHFTCKNGKEDDCENGTSRRRKVTIRSSPPLKLTAPAVALVVLKTKQTSVHCAMSYDE